MRVLVLLLLLLLPAHAPAQPLIADLSEHLIGISTSFTGTSVVLFGATDGPGDIVAVIRGPANEMTVRRKGRLGPIWINTRQVTFRDVPGFYSVAASRSLAAVAPTQVLALHQIGVENLRMPLAGSGRADAAEFREALLKLQQEHGLFPTTTGTIDFLGERLFRSTVVFPANVPTGRYTVEVFLIRDGEVVTAQTTPLEVSKIGVDAQLFDFADRQAAIYGLVAVAMAVVAGWAATLPFRSA
jgi:uncharacterized protein (TIGR02186 family)